MSPQMNGTYQACPNSQNRQTYKLQDSEEIITENVSFITYEP